MRCQFIHIFNSLRCPNSKPNANRNPNLSHNYNIKSEGNQKPVILTLMLSILIYFDLFRTPSVSFVHFWWSLSINFGQFWSFGPLRLLWSRWYLALSASRFVNVYNLATVKIACHTSLVRLTYSYLVVTYEMPLLYTFSIH